MKSFDDFPAAFAYCRECNKPMVVIINGQRWKLFPSGRAEKQQAVKEG